MSIRLEEVIGKRLAGDQSQRVIWWKGTWWDAEKVEQKTEECASILREAGFQPGSRLAAFLPNSPLVLLLSMAAWRLGGTFAPLNPRGGVEWILRILDHLDPFAVVVGEEMTPLEEAIRGAGIPVVAAPSDGVPPAFTGKRDRIGQDPEIAVMFATSGTTGAPKAVPLTHENLYDNTKGVHETIEGFDKGRVLMNILPNFHSFGYTVSGLMPLVRNLKQTILASFLPPVESMKAIHASGTNVIVAVPAMLHFMIIAADKGAPAPRGLKMVVTGGDRLNVQLDAKARAVLGAGVVEGYGLTECSPVVAVNNNYEKRRLGTVGPFIGGYEWRLRDDKNADVTASGEGVLWVRGPSVTDGYFRDPAMTAERFEDGWFNTGDYVRIEEGYVQILDRVTDIIIVGGFNVYPQEVEAIINSHPSVAQAVVVGMPHPVNGQVPKAFVQLKEGAQATSRELIDFCKHHLAHFKVPRSVEFMEALPLSSTGKVLRRLLREQK